MDSDNEDRVHSDEEEDDDEYGEESDEQQVSKPQKS